MFDISGMVEFWSKMAAKKALLAEEELFKAKLSRAGVSAPFGTPPAKEQLAKVFAKADLANGGSGNVFGEKMDDNGLSHNKIKAMLVAGNGMEYKKADFLADKIYPSS